MIAALKGDPGNFWGELKTTRINVDNRWNDTEDRLNPKMREENPGFDRIQVAALRRFTEFKSRRRSFGLDIGRADDLAPLFRLARNKVPEVGGGTGKSNAAQV
jgi:hypothetical protein